LPSPVYEKSTHRRLTPLGEIDDFTSGHGFEPCHTGRRNSAAFSR
jgi:hypothetical protein